MENMQYVWFMVQWMWALWGTVVVRMNVGTAVFDADFAQMSAFTHRHLPVCLCVKSLTAVAAKYDDCLSLVQVFVFPAIAL